MANMDIDYTRRNKKPRLLSDSEKDKLDEFIDSIHYSSRQVTFCRLANFFRIAENDEGHGVADGK